MNTKSKWLLGVAALGVCLAGVLWSVTEHVEPQSTPPSTNKVKFVDMQWHDGSFQQYQLQVDSIMKMTLDKTAAPQAMSVHMQGVLTLHTLNVQRNSALVGMQFSKLALTISGQSDNATNQALQMPFRVRFGSGGMPESFEFPQGISAQHRSMLENTIRTFQVAMRQDKTWNAQETNASGAYQATYTRITPSQLTKAKHDFSGSQNPLLADASIASQESIQLDTTHDWLAGMQVDETLQGNSPRGPNVEMKNKASIALLPASAIMSTTDWNFAATTAPADNDTDTEKSQAPKLSPQQARSQLLAALRELDTTKQGRIIVVHRLRDLLRMDDSLPVLLINQLKTQTFTDRTRADLYLALELSDTNAAQGALRSVITDTSWPIADDLRAIVALGGISHPTPSTLQVLWDVADVDQRKRLASPATYAIGILGNSMKTEHDPDYSVITQRLLNGALNGQDVQRRTNYVYALGNTRDPALSNDVAGLLDEKSPAIRRAAAQSLAQMGTDQHAGELMSRFKQEADPSVRGAIVETLTTWKAPTASAVATIRNDITSEGDQFTRLQMARFLGGNLQKFPESKAVLQTMLRTEQSKEIRQTIAEALATANGIGGAGQ